MTAFLSLPLPSKHHISKHSNNALICKISSTSSQSNNDYKSIHKSSPSPLPPTQSISLLSRLLSQAVHAENYNLAAKIRDTIAITLQKKDPASHLLPLLNKAVQQEDYHTAALLRDRIDSLRMQEHAQRARPRFAMGMVVKHKTAGHRMLIFGVDSRKRPAPVSKSFVTSDELQPWYHAAVDERDKIVGDNVVYVPQDVLEPLPHGTYVQHPITRIMFRGIYGKDVCPTYSCYVPGCRIDENDLDDIEEDVEEAELGDGAHFYNIDDEL